MSNYYLLSWEQKCERSCAFTQDETILGFELIPELEGKKGLPFDFTLKRVKEKRNGIDIIDSLVGLERIWDDYQANSLAWPLMSERLMLVFQNHLTGNEKIDWISCKIKNGRDEKDYYILRFNKLLDVLDLKKTKFISGTRSIRKPVFALDKVKKYNVFMTATSDDGDLWRIPPGFYISETLKKAIHKERLTGIDFTKTPLG